MVTINIGDTNKKKMLLFMCMPIESVVTICEFWIKILQCAYKAYSQKQKIIK